MIRPMMLYSLDFPVYFSPPLHGVVACLLKARILQRVALAHNIGVFAYPSIALANTTSGTVGALPIVEIMYTK